MDEDERDGSLLQAAELSPALWTAEVSRDSWNLHPLLKSLPS